MDIFGRYVPSSSSFIILCIISINLCVEAMKFSTVIIKRNGKRVCSGSYKDPQTIVTAASCVSQGKVEDYKITFQDPSKEPVSVKSIAMHSKKKGKVNDIAMLYLTDTVTRNGKTKEIKGRFATRRYDLKLQQNKYPECVILDPIKYKDTAIYLLPNSDCSRYNNGQTKKEQLCFARRSINSNRCPTGQGNPIVCTINGGSSVQIGIHIDNSGCSNRVMVGTRISRFRAWLRKPSKYDAVFRKRNGNGGTASNNGTIIAGGNLIKNGSNNGTIDGGNGTIDGGNGTINGGNGTIDGGNGTIDAGNGTNGEGNNNTSTGTGPINRTCTNSEFRCPDGTCITKGNVCDGKNDCPCGLADESSCGCDLAGTEFVTGFLHNTGPEVSILYIMAVELTNVTVTIPFLSYQESKLIQGAYKWKFEDTTLVMDEKYSQKGVHVKSDMPITVVAANSRELSYTTVDGTIVYPVNCLSSEYLVEVQSHRTYKTSQYAIIGIQNTTTNITITNKKGRVFHEQLGYLDSYFLQEKDLRGTSISATENVAVISGSECGFVPSGMTASCDHLVNQVPPRSMFGHAYIVAQQEPRKGFAYRVKAAEDNTVVTVYDINGEVIRNKTINVLTEYFKMELDSQPLSITANKGILVTQYALDAVIDDLGLGDPSMVILPALNLFDSTYDFVIPDYFLRVGLTIYISACHDPKGLLLDGKEVRSTTMTLVTIPEYGDYYVINVDLESKWTTYGYSSLSHSQRDVTFGAIMYGIRVEGAFAWRIGGKL